MNDLKLIGRVILAVGLLGTTAAVARAQASSEACGVVPLVAGGGNQGIVVGRVLANDGDVTFRTDVAPNYNFGTYLGNYDISGAWTITSVHVAVSCTEPPEFPVSKDGNPRVGRFPYSEKSLPLGTQRVDIPTASCAGETYVAAHATVTKNDGSSSETAWGIELPFSRLTGASQWAQYFHFNTSACQTTSTAPKLPPNGRPVANPDSYEAQQDTNLLVPPPGVLANDTDPDGDAIQTVTSEGPTSAGGAFALLGGAFSYSPKPGFTGTDSFLYTVTDSNGNQSDPAKVTIRVSAREVTPPEPTPLICTQCTGIECLLYQRDAACPSGTDLCYTEVTDFPPVDGRESRGITRGCGSTQDDPPPAEPSADCKEIETRYLNGTTCRFYCDKNNCNVPPNLIPLTGRFPAW